MCIYFNHIQDPQQGTYFPSPPSILIAPFILPYSPLPPHLPFFHCLCSFDSPILYSPPQPPFLPHPLLPSSTQYNNPSLSFYFLYSLDSTILPSPLLSLPWLPLSSNSFLLSCPLTLSFLSLLFLP